jgi:hydroxypyruvate isomerase
MRDGRLEAPLADRQRAALSGREQALRIHADLIEDFADAFNRVTCLLGIADVRQDGRRIGRAVIEEGLVQRRFDTGSDFVVELVQLLVKKF